MLKNFVCACCGRAQNAENIALISSEFIGLGANGRTVCKQCANMEIVRSVKIEHKSTKQNIVERYEYTVVALGTDEIAVLNREYNLTPRGNTLVGIWQRNASAVAREAKSIDELVKVLETTITIKFSEPVENLQNVMDTIAELMTSEVEIVVQDDVVTATVVGNAVFAKNFAKLLKSSARLAHWFSKGNFESGVRAVRKLVVKWAEDPNGFKAS